MKKKEKKQYNNITPQKKYIYFFTQLKGLVGVKIKCGICLFE